MDNTLAERRIANIEAFDKIKRKYIQKATQMNA